VRPARNGPMQRQRISGKNSPENFDVADESCLVSLF
jgi:hypothetical protein